MTSPVRIPRATDAPPHGPPVESPSAEVVFQPAEGEPSARRSDVPEPVTPAHHRPGWLRPRAPTPPPLLLPADYEPEGGSWLRRAIGSEGARGMLVSLVVHGLVLFGLSLWVIHQHGNEFGLTINSAFVADDVNMIADVELQGAIDDPGGEVAPLRFVPVADQLNTATDFTPSDSITGHLGGEGKGVDKGAGGQLPEMAGIRVPTYAITKGSFSVWTEPKDPLPRRPYRIVIQIRVPTDLAERAKVYPLSRDITAEVKGTDRYTMKTNFKGTEPPRIEDGIVRTSIVIPGADQLIRDHIKVTSKMLKETQEFDIEF